MFVEYEDSIQDYYIGDKKDKKILTNPENKSTSTMVSESAKKLINPFDSMYIWIKGEFLDIKGMNECIVGREIILRGRKAAEDKLRANE